MKDSNIASDFNPVDSVSVSVPWMHLEQCRLNNADNYQDSVEHLIVIQTDTTQIEIRMIQIHNDTTVGS